MDYTGPGTLTLRRAYSVKFDEAKSGFKHEERTHGGALRLWDRLVTNQEEDNDETTENIRQRCNEDTHQEHNKTAHQGCHENVRQREELQSSSSVDKKYIEGPESNTVDRETDESLNSQNTNEEDWIPSDDERMMRRNRYGSHQEADDSNLGLRRSASERRQFDTNRMPSGTLEMENLRMQIDADSEPSDDEGYYSPNGESEQPSNLALCMALQMNDQLPKTWKQAINEINWFTAMKNEINELREKGAWELVERDDNMNVLPGVWTYRAKKDEKGEVVRYKARWCVNGSFDKFR